jgi:hypothetical protein
MDAIPDELQDLLNEGEVVITVLPETEPDKKYSFFALSDGRVAVIEMKAGE